MKTLPGIKIVAFLALVSLVGVAVYGGTKEIKASKKKHKIMVGFGWSETSEDHLNPVPHSINDIKAYFAGTDKPHRYKMQQYADGLADGAPEGDLYICLPTPTPPPAANAAPSPASAQASPSGTPTTGAKTQTAGYAQFDDQEDSDNFVEWVNSIEGVPSKGSAKPKGTKKK